uniref:Protein ENL n=1 Tax=Bactrocera dorsalis TaxID=27457 RepID=A0A034VIT4_BACDO
MAVKVQFEIGHTARLRSKKTSEGFTHDWELYVRGVKEADISTYVDKVVFNLHDSFPKPKRVCNKPPYVITESGYAGFLLPIDIYFRNRDEPKRIQFTYDLDLQQTGPPHHRFEVQKFVFDHVSDEFRQKLLKGGGIPVTGAGMVGGATVTSTNNTPNAAISDEGGGMVSKPKLSSGESIGGSSGKKHKTRIDDSKSNSFANLFGAPIKSGSSKHSPDGKNNSLNTVGGKGAPSTSNASGSGAGTGGAATPNSGNINSNNSIAKEKSSKDREKTNSSTLASSSNEKSREKSDKKEKHKSSSSPNKESRSENKKSSGDSSKHEKREESKSKKDKSRDKERERSREKGSSGGTKRSLSPKSNVRDAGAPSPKRPTPPRSSSSASGRVEDIKSAGSSSKIEGKESKSREEKSTSSGKKSKKEKKDKDKDKERDKERRDEHKEKHRSGDGKSRDPKEERHGNIINSSSNTVTTATTPSGNIVTNEAKDNKGQQSPANFSIKKPDKDAKEKTEAVKGKNNDKNIDKISTNPTTTQVGGTNAISTSSDKKLPTSSNNQSEKLEKEKDKDKEKEKDKEKRSHKHKKKDKNKDKDKEREKERDKERHKEREKEKEKERDKERSEEKLRSEKHTETNSNGNASSMGAASTAISGSKASSLLVETTVPQNETSKPEPNSVTSLSNSTSNSTNSNNLNNNANGSAPIAPIKKSQNRDRKNKDKSSKEEKRNSGELGELESRSSSKHGNKSAGTIIPANTNTTVTVSNTTGNNSSKTVDASDTGKVPLPEDAALLTATSDTNPAAVTSTDIAPVVMHSDSSNSSFPDLTPKPPAPSKLTSQSTKSETTPTEKPDKTTSIITKEHKQRSGERNAKTKDISDKTEKADKKVEKEEKKRRRSSVAASTVSANSFLEPPLKQAKKESNKTAREQTKSPALRQSRAASISGPIGINNGNDNGSNSSNATTQNSNTTDALNSGGAFLPPPNNTTGTSVTSSPSTLAITSNTNANLNANSIVSASTTGAAAAASLAPPHPLRPASPAGPVGAMAAEAAGANNGSTPTPALPTEYLSELQELHHKIMTLQDNEELQQVVEMIAATGCYEITAKTFDFDLCKLDRSTVQRLQEFFATSVS